MPGVYSYDKVRVKDDGKIDVEHVTKTRGADPKKYSKEKEAHVFLIGETLKLWRADYRSEGKNPALTRDYKKYITIGAALASVARFKTAGRWSPAPGRPNAAQRVISLSDPGNKRVLTDFDGDCLSTTGREAPRCHLLSERRLRGIPTKRCHNLAYRIGSTKNWANSFGSKMSKTLLNGFE